MGKTSLLTARTSQCCSIWYHPNIFDTYQVKVSQGSATIELEVWDTSGKDCVFSAWPNVHQAVNVYLLCFALNSPTSYRNVQTKWYPEVLRYAPDVPIILVGTQLDIRNESVKGVGMVTQQMGEQLKEQINAHAYIECSAVECIRLV